jgi:hypothetical protein
MNHREKDLTQQTAHNLAGVGPEEQVANNPPDQPVSEWLLLKRAMSDLSAERKAPLRELDEQLKRRQIVATRYCKLKGPVPPHAVILDDRRMPPIYMIAGRSVSEWIRAIIEGSATCDEFIARVDGTLATRESENITSINCRIGVLVGRLPTTVIQVIASYSGSCDSGEFDEIAFLDEAKNAVEVDAFVYEDFKWRLYDLLNLEHAGWENNDGASGAITLSVPEKSINIDHTSYFTDSFQNSTHHNFTV